MRFADMATYTAVAGGTVGAVAVGQRGPVKAEFNIDIAWPARDRKPLVDPLIYCEAELTGAPPYTGNEGRGATADWSNRRKELKFQATDLKLYRQAQNTQIDNWDLWRRTAPPSVYSLWAARVADPPTSST